MCVCCARDSAKEKESENTRKKPREDEEAPVSFLKPSYDIIYTKQTIVARGNFRELPLLRLICPIHR